MKLRMVTGIAGVDFSLAPGDLTERFSEAEAIRLVAAGFALPFADVEIERAVAVKPIERRKSKGKP